MSAPNPTPPKNTYGKKALHGVGRLLLFAIPLELLLPLVPIPPAFEAGVWHGNSYRDRYWTETKVDHNALGYRDVDWEQSSLKPRIAFLGDSRFYGQYVDSNQTFSAIVQRKSSWETLNFGLPGASVYEANDFILRDALEYGPQKVVLCYDVNSSLFSIMSRAQGGSRYDVWRNLLRSSLIFRWLELGYYAVFQDVKPVMSLETYEETLETMILRLQRSGVDVVLVIGWTELQDFPQLYTQERYDLFRQKGRDVAKKHKLPVIEIEEILQGQDLDTIFVGMEKMHFSKTGHRFFAEHLMTALSLRDSHAP